MLCLAAITFAAVLSAQDAEQNALADVSDEELFRLSEDLIVQREHEFMMSIAEMDLTPPAIPQEVQAWIRSREDSYMQRLDLRLRTDFRPLTEAEKEGITRQLLELETELDLQLIKWELTALQDGMEQADMYLEKLRWKAQNAGTWTYELRERLVELLIEDQSGSVHSLPTAGMIERIQKREAGFLAKPVTERHAETHEETREETREHTIRVLERSLQRDVADPPLTAAEKLQRRNQRIAFLQQRIAELTD